MLLLRCLKHTTKLHNNSERSSVIYTPGVFAVFAPINVAYEGRTSRPKISMWSLGHALTCGARRNSYIQTLLTP